jgi:hypothetical protein
MDYGNDEQIVGSSTEIIRLIKGRKARFIAHLKWVKWPLGRYLF